MVQSTTWKWIRPQTKTNNVVWFSKWYYPSIEEDYCIIKWIIAPVVDVHDVFGRFFVSNIFCQNKS